MKKTALVLALALLSACSGKSSGEAEQNAAASAPLKKVKYVSPLAPTKDPAVARRQQEELVAAMLRDPRVDLETIQGEAYRRGVTLTPEQVAAKRAMPVDRNGSPGAVQPAPAEQAATGNAQSAS